MDRVRPKHFTPFVKGMPRPKGAGRKKGTPNKFSGTIKDLAVDALTLKGNALVAQLEYFEEQVEHYLERIRNTKDRPRRLVMRRKHRRYCNLVREYEQYRDGGAEAAMLWLQNQEPGTYLQLIARLLPLQIQGKMSTSTTHRFETVKDVEEEFRRRGLPPPPRLMVDVTPNKVAQEE